MSEQSSQSNNQSKIVSYCGKNNGCYWYRNKTPFDSLKRKGLNVNLADYGDVVGDDIKMVQFSRGYNPGYEQFFFILRKKGIKIWYEVDDALDLVKPENPFSGPTLGYLGSYYFLLNESDFITTTNERLAEHLRTKTSKPVYVFPNCLNPKEWPERSKTVKGLRIGFAGSASHIKDLLIIMPVIEALQKKYDFTFVLFGLDADCKNIDEWLERQIKNCGGRLDDMEYGRAVQALYDYLKRIKHEWNECVRWEMYPKRLTKLDFDIGVCPLEDNDFNKMKSPIKFYEYAITGTPALCSNVHPFKDECLAVADNTFESWYEHLEALIMHEELRDSVQKAQKEYVMNNRLIDNNIETLENIIKKYE